MKKLSIIIAALLMLISTNLYADDDYYSIYVVNNTSYPLTLKASDLTRHTVNFTTPVVMPHTPITLVATNKMIDGNIDALFTIQATKERNYFSRPLLHYMYMSDPWRYKVDIDPQSPITIEGKKYNIHVWHNPEATPNIVIDVSPATK